MSTGTTDASTLEATIEVEATPDQVWAVVSDLERMAEWSPECRMMKVLGAAREGAHVIGVNKRGLAVWPTNSRIVRYEPGRAIAWRVYENRTTWSYELDETPTGTTITERRVAPQGISTASKLLSKAVLGGVENHDAEPLEGMQAGLARIRTAVERG